MTGRQRLTGAGRVQAHSSGALPADRGHGSAVRDAGLVSPGHAREVVRLGLTPVERVAATAVVADSDPVALAALEEQVRATAQALAGDERDEARVRLLAREISIQKSLLDLLTVHIGGRLQAGDVQGARVADRLATSTAKRLTLLVAEHRASCRRDTHPVVAITNTAVIQVEAGTR